jgi:hypothetical protein
MLLVADAAIVHPGARAPFSTASDLIQLLPCRYVPKGGIDASDYSIRIYMACTALQQAIVLLNLQIKPTHVLS